LVHKTCLSPATLYWRIWSRQKRKWSCKYVLEVLNFSLSPLFSEGMSWSWSHGRLDLQVESSNPTLGEVYMFSPGTPVSSTNKSDCHDIPQVLSEMALNTITHITTIFRLDDGTVLTDFCFLVFPQFIDYLHCTITWNCITEKNNHISYFIFIIYYFRVVFTLTDIIEI
jgi:hypothetical protein